eukprot:TRINITY_DN186_c0_g2_i3.p1 TRINITY_DN186_c0_g2~~TRINITY_DN186_c0_g2_i3.p1  ORF type:complete len:194 (+),score=53.33 TRINITY_DN186_c0_g2_i3:100-681(+)
MAPRTKVIDSSTPQSSPSKISSTKVMKKERSRKTKTSTPVHVRSPKKLPPSEKTDDESTWDEDEFEVEEIRASKVDLGKKFYLIKWVVFDEDEKTWEPEENIFGHKLVAKFEEQEKKKSIWQYFLERSVDGKRPGWHNYEAEASNEVEKAYQAWKLNPIVDINSVQSGSWHYKVVLYIVPANLFHSSIPSSGF